MRPFYNFENTEQLTSYLRNTLIPDLRDSGSDATADDFSDCATHIEQLTDPATPPACPHECAACAEDRYKIERG